MSICGPPVVSAGRSYRTRTSARRIVYYPRLPSLPFPSSNLLVQDPSLWHSGYLGPVYVVGLARECLSSICIECLTDGRSCCSFVLCPYLQRIPNQLHLPLYPYPVTRLGLLPSPFRYSLCSAAGPVHIRRLPGFSFPPCHYTSLSASLVAVLGGGYPHPPFRRSLPDLSICSISRRQDRNVNPSVIPPCQYCLCRPPSWLSSVRHRLALYLGRIASFRSVSSGHGQDFVVKHPHRSAQLYHSPSLPALYHHDPHPFASRPSHRAPRIV